MKATLAIINGQILTMDKKNPICEAIAVNGERIIAVGTVAEIEKYVDSATEVFDARNQTVVPGFIDTHVHFTGTGLNATSLYLNPCSSLQGFIDTLVEGEKKLTHGRWLRGYGYDESKFPENRLPSLEEVDRLFPDRPMLLGRTDSHSCFLNSRAIEILEIDLTTNGIVKEDGKLTGVFRAESNALVRKLFSDKFTDFETRKESLFLAADLALKVGLTTVHALEGGTLFSDTDVPAFIELQESLPIRTLLYHQTTDIDKVLAYKLPRIGGCITIDGSLGSYTAALSDPYSDDPTCYGTTYFTQEEVDQFVMRAHKEGMQVAMHTIGDRAIEMLLSAYEKALVAYPREDHRHRFEHFSVPTWEQIERAKAIDVVIAVQPSFDYFGQKGTMIRNRLGAERRKRVTRLRSLVEGGLLIAGGSDSDITPMSPLLGIYASLTHSIPSESLSIYEAIKIFTYNGAYMGFEEKEKGSLEVGKLADITMIKGNIYETPLPEIKDLEISYTIVGGEVKYQNG